MAPERGSRLAARKLAEMRHSDSRSRSVTVIARKMYNYGHSLAFGAAVKAVWGSRTDTDESPLKCCGRLLTCRGCEHSLQLAIGDGVRRNRLLG